MGDRIINGGAVQANSFKSDRYHQPRTFDGGKTVLYMSQAEANAFDRLFTDHVPMTVQTSPPDALDVVANYLGVKKNEAGDWVDSALTTSAGWVDRKLDEAGDKLKKVGEALRKADEGSWARPKGKR